MNVYIHMKQMIFTNWHLMRWLRLGLGIFVAVQAVQSHDTLSGLIAFFFLYQAATNTGCCGSGECVVPVTSEKMNQSKAVVFEEVEPNKK